MTFLNFTPVPQELLRRGLKSAFYTDADGEPFFKIHFKNQTFPIPAVSDIKGVIRSLDRFINGQLSKPEVEIVHQWVSDNHALILGIQFKQQNQDEDQNRINDATGSGNAQTDKQNNNKHKQVDLITEIIERYRLKLFKDEYDMPHSTVLVNDHLEILPINGSKFERWLMGIFYRDFKEILNAKELKELIDILNAKAIFESGDPIKLNLRVAQRSEAGVCGNTISSNCKTIWDYDLTNQNHEFVEITSKGWNLMKNDNTDIILFRRFSNQLPQFYPLTEYDPDIFDKFMNLLLNKNLHDEGNRADILLLVKCYIISLFIPEIPKPVLMPYGHQGAAKTSFIESIKRLVDPSIVKTLSFPRDVNELIQQLSHNYVAYYDNISRLNDWTSDQICRAVTGSGSTVRRLYTSDDDVIRSFKRCIGLNGVNLAASKPDLLDRGIPIHLKRIEEKDRLIIDNIETQLSKMIPQLLGFIFDILVKVLKFKETQKTGITEYPRMADFAEYGEIISRCMGFKPYDFMNAYKNNVSLQIDEIIESSDVAICLVYLMFTKYGEEGGDYRREWEGTASALLGELNVVGITEDLNVNVKDRHFPKHGNKLRRRLNEIIPTLKEKGLEITFSKTNDKKRLRIIKICKVSSEPPDRPTG